MVLSHVKIAKLGKNVSAVNTHAGVVQNLMTEESIDGTSKEISNQIQILYNLYLIIHQITQLMVQQ